MAIEDDLFDLGIVPYPTEFPNEDDVIQSINNELFELADVGFVSDADAVSQILDFEKSVLQENSIDDFSSISTPTDFISQSSKNVSANDAVDGWHSVSYAYGLANSQFRPKLKFMFYVDFMLKPEFSELANEFWARNMSFNAKTVDRPKLSFEFEDINQYNFKTKVVKGSKYEDVSITFYDDSSNSVIDFFRFVLSLFHPITRRSNTMSSDLSTGSLSMLEGHGMSFSGDTFDTSDLSHRGVVNTDNGQIFQVIKVTQTYIVPSGDLNARQISYLYVNPTISSIELNELSAEDSSNTCEVTLKFSFDAIVIPNTEGLQTPRNPMPNVGEVRSDFSINGNNSLGGFGGTASKNVNVQSSLDSFIENMEPPSSGGFLASSFVPGLSTNKNLNLNSPDVGVADVQRTVISEAKRYGMSQVPPEARKIIGQIENQFKIINRPSGSARQPQFLNNLISDSSTPGDDIFGFKL